MKILKPFSYLGKNENNLIHINISVKIHESSGISLITKNDYVQMMISQQTK